MKDLKIGICSEEVFTFIPAVNTKFNALYFDTKCSLVSSRIFPLFFI